MAKGYNLVVLEGNLVRDADIRMTHSKQKVARFTLAIGADYKKSNGDWVEHTDFIDCLAWGSTAEIIEKYTAKGRPLLVEGKIQKREYEKDGHKRYITEVVVSQIVLIAYARDSNNNNTREPMPEEEPSASDYGTPPGQVDIQF